MRWERQRGAVSKKRPEGRMGLKRLLPRGAGEAAACIDMEVRLPDGRKPALPTPPYTLLLPGALRLVPRGDVVRTLPRECYFFRAIW